jgi:pilus assembly protein Flp/PilA
LREEAGANATEYALLASLIAVALVSGASAFGNALGGTFSNVASKVPSL